MPKSFPFMEFLKEHRDRMTLEEKRIFERDRSVFRISSVIYAGRKQAGLSQFELAEKAGVEQADISRYEHGSQTPSLDTFFRIIRALDGNVTVSFGPSKTSNLV